MSVHVTHSPSASATQCQMTMEGDFSHYFECCKPAKFTIRDSLRRVIRICGIHANALRRRGKGDKIKPFEPPRAK